MIIFVLMAVGYFELLEYFFGSATATSFTAMFALSIALRLDWDSHNE